MLTKLICLLIGHIRRTKTFSPDLIKANNINSSVVYFRWKDLKRCDRCGAKL